jgi:hypothetical protein
MQVRAGFQDWVVSQVHVTFIEMKVGNSFRFFIDRQAGPCAAGSPLLFDARFYDPSLQPDMVKTVYAAVLATKLSGQTLDVFGDNTPVSGNCIVGIVNSH